MYVMEDINRLLEHADRCANKASKSYLGGMLFLIGMNDNDYKQQKWEEAAELYIKVANQYRMNKQLIKAGEMYKKASDAYRNSGNKHETASYLIKASDCLDNQKTEYLSQAITIYLEDGQFGIGARHTMKLAGILESDDKLSDAIDAYQKAADLYIMDSSNSTSTILNLFLKNCKHLWTIRKL